MSRDFPALVDLWHLVRSRRGFEGSWPLARMHRLKESLAAGNSGAEEPEGDAQFQMEFGTDPQGIPFAEVRVQASLRLICQRTLEPFDYPVDREVRLGLIRSESDEAALPDGYEPFLVPDEDVRLTDLAEDELILAVPLVPMSPGESVETEFGPKVGEGIRAGAAPEENDDAGPFAALASLKEKHSQEPD